MSKSSTAIEAISNPTPGEMLLADFIEPMGLSRSGLARAIGVPPRRINEIVLGKRSVTADTDLRLARYFGLSEGFWLGVQADYDPDGASPPDRRRSGQYRAASACRLKSFTKGLYDSVPEASHRDF